jgi:hypothetical protein
MLEPLAQVVGDAIPDRGDEWRRCRRLFGVICWMVRTRNAVLLLLLSILYLINYCYYYHFSICMLNMVPVLRLRFPGYFSAVVQSHRSIYFKNVFI